MDKSPGRLIEIRGNKNGLASVVKGDPIPADMRGEVPATHGIPSNVI